MRYIISYDLGTGGTKASLFDEKGKSHASAFVPCKTYYGSSNFREQRPDEWWESVKASTRKMLSMVKVEVDDIKCMAVSGHSLGVVPIDSKGNLLADKVPIWNDARADKEAADFFTRVNEEEWYLTTGNGFPPPLYSVFKIMWYKKNNINLYKETYKFLGTKDYINYRLTDMACTDNSYASGSGLYSLRESKYWDPFIKEAGIHRSKLPDIHKSTYILGTIKPSIANELGLSPGTQVACGGVDNACMALGAACTKEGDSYTSLGTSAWIAVSSSQPIVNAINKPYVFAHCIPNEFVSATCIFSAGNSLRWVRDNFCRDLIEKQGLDVYAAMIDEARESVIGANKLMFNPSLAGGCALDDSPNIRGGFFGIDLMHKRSDVIRATLEGITLNLRIAMDVLESYVKLSENMLIVGGGGKSRFWRELFAHIYNKNILQTNIGEDAGSLGAAAVAAVGCGIWTDFTILKEIHDVEDSISPNKKMAKQYEVLLPVFQEIARMQAIIGDMLMEIPTLNESSGNN